MKGMLIWTVLAMISIGWAFESGTVIEFSELTASAIHTSPLKHHCLFFSEKNTIQHSKVMALFGAIAEQHKEDLLVVYIPETEVDVRRHFNVKLGTSFFCLIGLALVC